MIFRPSTVWIGGLCKGYIMNAYLGLRGELLFWWLVLCCLTHLCLTADFVSWFLCFFIAEILGHRLDEHCILDEAWWLNWWNEWNSQLWTVWNKTRFKLFYSKAHSFLHTYIYIYIKADGVSSGDILQGTQKPKVGTMHHTTNWYPVFSLIPNYRIGILWAMNNA